MNQNNIVTGTYEGTTGRTQFKNWIISEIEKEILALHAWKQFRLKRRLGMYAAEVKPFEHTSVKIYA